MRSEKLPFLFSVKRLYDYIDIVRSMSRVGGCFSCLRISETQFNVILQIWKVKWEVSQNDLCRRCKVRHWCHFRAKTLVRSRLGGNLQRKLTYFKFLIGCQVVALCYAAPYGFGMVKTSFRGEFVWIHLNKNFSETDPVYDCIFYFNVTEIFLCTIF